MTGIDVQGGGTNAGPQPRMASDFPDILERIAKVLEEAGCGQVEIRLALLAMCGVPVQSVSQLSLRTFG